MNQNHKQPNQARHPRQTVEYLPGKREIENNENKLKPKHDEVIFQVALLLAVQVVGTLFTYWPCWYIATLSSLEVFLFRQPWLPAATPLVVSIPLNATNGGCEVSFTLVRVTQVSPDYEPLSLLRGPPATICPLRAFSGPQRGLNSINSKRQRGVFRGPLVGS